MTTLILVRHGQSEANLERSFAGHTNVNLTELGMLQAKKSAQYIKENYNISKVYASDLLRAYHTGKAIADETGVPIVTTESVREVFAGDWEGKKFTDLATIYDKDYTTWLTDIGNARCTNGESVRELCKRFTDEIIAIAEENPDSQVVVATHATPIRALQTLIEHGDLDEMKNVSWAVNASVTTVTYDNGKLTLISAGESAHLGDLVSKDSKKV